VVYDSPRHTTLKLCHLHAIQDKCLTVGFSGLSGEVSTGAAQAEVLANVENPLPPCFSEFIAEVNLNRD
jgi:hypothetical protein